MPIRKIQAGYISTVTADEYIGEPGTIFYNADVGDLRLSDGLTLGGIALSVGGGGGFTNKIVVGTSNVQVYSSYVNVTVAGNTVAWFNSTGLHSNAVYSDNYFYANGQAISFGGTGTSYSNANVKSYLTSFDGNLVPSVGNVFSLGSSTNWWKDLFVSSNTIYIGGTAVTTNEGNLYIGNAIVGTSTQGTVFLDEDTALSVSGNTLLINNVAIQASSVSWANVADKPTFSSVATSGDYNDLTNKPNDYSLPTATASTKGGVKVGQNINISVDGTISVPKGAGINKVIDIPDIHSANLNAGHMMVYNAGVDRWDTKAQQELGAFNLDGGEF